jgi:DNA-binding transcriptional LysR family regulator
MFEKLFTQSGLSLERLKTFAEIVTAGGISLAAQSDANRQSQFSRQLKELEKYFGVELLKRNRGPMQLTDAGHRLHQIIGHGFRALEDFRGSCENQPVELVLGAGESMIQWFLVPRLAGLANTRKNLALTFRNLRTAEIVRGLQEAGLDFGCVTRAISDPGLGSCAVGRFEFGLFVPRSLINPRRRLKSPSDLLQGLPLAMLEGSPGVRAAVEAECRQRGFEPEIRFCFSSYPQLAHAVQHLRVAAILPTLAGPALAGTDVRPVGLPFLKALTRDIHLVWSKRMADVRPAIGEYSKLFRAGLDTSALSSKRGQVG